MYSIHRHLVVVLLASVSLLSQSLSAQTPAATRVVRGCLQAAPAGSLRTALTSPPMFRHDANAHYAFEAEATPLSDSWVLETANAGYSGAGYLRWSGRNLFNTPGTGVLTFGLWCDQPQRFRLQMHNRHDHQDPSEENDCWMSINGSAWRKIYSNDNRNAQVWNWHTRVDPGHGWLEFDLAQGANELRVSARSANFKLDRIHIFPRGLGRLEDLQLPLSARLRERPVLGTSIALEVGDPQDQARLPRGTTSAFVLMSTSPHPGSCGMQVPGFGANGALGELLLNPSIAMFVVPFGTWNGPTSPARLRLAVPTRSALVGSTVYSQGILLDAATARGVLTDRLDLVLGDS